MNTNFHMTYDVAVSTTGAVAPLLLIIPGQRSNRDLLNECDIPGAVVICVPKGFINDFFREMVGAIYFIGL